MSKSDTSLDRQMNYLRTAFNSNMTDSKLVEVIYVLGELGKKEEPKPSYNSGGDNDHTIRKGIAMILGEIRCELDYARDKFPSSVCCLAACTEELGELAQAMLKHAAGKWPQSRVREEAIQVAAMAIRCAIEGDPSLTSIGYSEPNVSNQ